MLAELRVTPVGSDGSFARLMAQLLPVIAESPVQYQMHAMGTTLEGDLGAILDLVRRAHAELRPLAPRLLIELSLDDRDSTPQEIVRSLHHVAELGGWCAVPQQRLLLEHRAPAPVLVTMAERVRSCLERHRVPYKLLTHEEDFSSAQTAHHTHTPGEAFAKAVVVRAGERHLMAVLPAHHALDLTQLAQLCGHRQLRLAPEKDIEQLFPDCEVGAVPPFGNLYGLPVYVSSDLSLNPELTGVAGGHCTAIRLSWSDYEWVVRPTVGDISR